MAATESGLSATVRSSLASPRAKLGGPGTTLADERLLPVIPALPSLLPGRGLRRGAPAPATPLERLPLVPAPGARAWPTVVAALLDAVDVVLVRSPARLPAAQARRLAAQGRGRGGGLGPPGG